MRVIPHLHYPSLSALRAVIGPSAMGVDMIGRTKASGKDVLLGFGPIGNFLVATGVVLRVS